MQKIKSAEIFSKNPNALQCRCCNQYVDKGLIKHLTKLHNLTVSEYKAKFGEDAKIVSDETRKKLSENIKGEKNAWFNHSGKLSKFSKNHDKYSGLTEEEKEEAIAAFCKTRVYDVTKLSNHIEYYLARGMTEEEARLALSKRQKTFSLEKCIERLGAEAGLARWQDRQEKWHKSYKKTNYSQISQDLFKKLTIAAPDAIFAEHVMNGKNNEHVLRTLHGSTYKLDFFVPSTGKIIEFDGSYWHDQRELTGINKGRDKLRDEKILETDPSFRIYHVKEAGYRKNKEGIIQKCKEFLQS